MDGRADGRAVLAARAARLDSVDGKAGGGWRHGGSGVQVLVYGRRAPRRSRVEVVVAHVDAVVARPREAEDGRRLDVGLVNATPCDEQVHNRRAREVRRAQDVQSQPRAAAQRPRIEDATRAAEAERDVARHPVAAWDDGVERPGRAAVGGDEDGRDGPAHRVGREGRAGHLQGVGRVDGDVGLGVLVGLVALRVRDHVDDLHLRGRGCRGHGERGKREQGAQGRMWADGSHGVPPGCELSGAERIARYRPRAR